MFRIASATKYKDRVEVVKFEMFGTVVNYIHPYFLSTYIVGLTTTIYLSFTHVVWSTIYNILKIFHLLCTQSLWFKLKHSQAYSKTWVSFQNDNFVKRGSLNPCTLNIILILIDVKFTLNMLYKMNPKAHFEF